MIPAPLKTIADRLAVGWENRAIGLKAVSFAMVGVVNTLIDLSVFLTLYSGLGLALVPANVLAWFVAVSASYVMNSFITFAVESGRQLRWRDYATFLVSGIAGVIGNTTALVVASYFVPVLVAKLMAIVVSFMINFSLSHFVVFRRRREPMETGTKL